MLEKELRLLLVVASVNLQKTRSLFVKTLQCYLRLAASLVQA